MDDPAVTPNDLVAFLVEVGALVLLGAWAWQQGDSTVGRWARAIGVPAIAGVAWGLFAAPRARVGLLALEVATKIVVLGGAVVAGFVVLPRAWAVAFGVVVVVNTVLLYVGPWSRRTRRHDART